MTVIHKLAERPAYTSESLILEAVIFSETHKRLAARCYEDIAIYDYRAGKRATLHGYMVDALRQVYDLQDVAKAEADKTIEEMTRQIDARG